MHSTTRKTRDARGNMYVLFVGLIALLVAAFNLFAGVGLKAILQYKNRAALDAAALACASELSRIVVNDPYWGFVSLTDHPPIGKRTIAEDDEPLPVLGINTILATVRQEMIIAQATGSNEAIEAAREDLRAARKAARRLAAVLAGSLSSRDRGLEALDMNGEPVEPVRRARQIYVANASSMLSMADLEIDGFQARFGWLSGGGTTSTRVPRPSDLADLLDEHREGGCYRAFVDIPCCGESFYFAGLSDQSSLVENRLFRKADGKRICSIVELKVCLSSKGAGSERLQLQSVSCAQPFFLKDTTIPPIMAISFPHGQPAGVSTVRDLLTSRQMTRNIKVMSPSGGDYPRDRGAVLVSDPARPSMTVRQAFARGFMDWLRASHTSPRLDSLLAMLDRRFSSDTRLAGATSYMYTFDGRGDVIVIPRKLNPFRMQTAHDRQLYSVAFDAIQSAGISWTVRLRDQSRRLGTMEGGKHAGQPMPTFDFVKELDASTSTSDGRSMQALRRLPGAGSRYDMSRLALEFEVSSPHSITDGYEG